MKNKSENNSTIANFIWRFTERTAAQLVTFVVSIILARILSPEYYGTIALVTVFTTILQVFVDSGLGSALIQKNDADNLDFSTVFYFNIFWCFILYIAMYISETAEIYNEFYEKKELPINKISKGVLKSRQFLQKWRDYIIVYSLILGDYNYKYIADYLKIIRKKEDVEEKIDNNVISFNNIDNFNSKDKVDENDEYSNEESEEPSLLEDNSEKVKGVILYKRKEKAIILTSSGEFIKSKIDNENIGEEVSVNIKKKFKNIKFYIVILILFTICGLSIGTYKYFKGVTTIIFEADEQITLEVNVFNRVVRSKSNVSNVGSILEKVEVQDRDVDTAIYKLIKYCNEEEQISKGQVLITVTGNAIKHGVLSDTSQYISEEGINVKFNNAGYESNLK